MSIINTSIANGRKNIKRNNGRSRQHDTHTSTTREPSPVPPTSPTTVTVPTLPPSSGSNLVKFVLVGSTILTLGGALWLGGTERRRRQYKNNREATELHVRWKFGYCKAFEPAHDLTAFAIPIHPDGLIATERRRQRHLFQILLTKARGGMMPWLSSDELKKFEVLYKQFVALVDSDFIDRRYFYVLIERTLMSWRHATREVSVNTAEACVFGGGLIATVCIAKLSGII